jgi:outer membrane protein insertion porin family
MKFSFLVLYFIFAGKTWSQVPKGSVLNNKVSISCGRSIRCDHYKSVLVPRLKSPKYESQIKSVLSAILLEGDVEGLSYVWEQDSNVSSSFSIKIHFKIRPKIIESEIQIDTKIDVDALSTLLNIKAGSYLNNFSESDSENEVFKFMQDRGYYKSKVVFRKINFKGNLKLVIDITSGKRTLIRKVIVNSKKEAIKSSVKKTIKILEKSPYEILKLKEEMDLLKGRILSKGYYFLDFLYEAKWVDQSSKMVDLLVQIDEGPRLAFGFYGNKVFKTKELLGHVKTSVKSLGKSVQKSSYERILKEFYSKKGVHGTSIESYSIITKMKDGSKLQTFFFNIVEGRKILIKDLRFVGSGSFSNQKLKSVYYNQATVLALRDFYDQNYLEQFKEDLTRFYYKNGFVFFKVSDPYLKFDKRMESVKVEYLLSEGIQAHVDEINFEGLSQELINKVRPLLVNKRYQPLNIIALENDVKRLDTFVKDQGYIYSRLLSLKTKDLLKYKSDYRYADLSFKVQLGPLAILNNVILKGNKRTRDITILREVEVSPGDVVTPSLLREINNRINALGLFSKVEVSPVQTFVDNSSKIDLLINVQERDFGIFEVAPGFRTDIGLKLSSSVSYNNLSGKNRTVQFRGQVNQRLDFNTIDSQREANAKER